MGPHPDPDLLTAFAENSLRERERELVFSHLSSCADCRMIVALAQPVTETVPEIAAERASWLSWPMLRWGAAVACVAVVGAAVSLYREQPKQYVTAQSVQAERAASQPTSQPEETVLQKPEASERPARAESARRTDSVAAESPSSAPAESLGRLSNAPSAPARTAPQILDKVAGVNAAEKKETVAAGKAKQATEGEMSGASAANVGLTDRKSAAADMSLAAALVPRWTLNSDGTLQRSLDGGKSWTKIAISSNSVFRVVAALGSDVWVGGAAGSLFHSVDAGEHWSQVKPTDGKRILGDDITSIQFTDSVHGKITTSNEEVWSTEDGGSSWQQLW